MPTPAGERISEKELQKNVTQLATQCGWTWWHFHDSRREVVDKTTRARYLIGDKDARGYPDLTLCHPRRGIIFAELKGWDTAVDPDQTRSLNRLAEAAMAMSTSGAAKVRVHLWRPRDFPLVVVPLLSRNEGPIVYGLGDD